MVMIDEADCGGVKLGDADAEAGAEEKTTAILILVTSLCLSRASVGNTAICLVF